jgi:hypothetical protein
MAKAAKQAKPAKFKPPAVACTSLDDADALFREWADLLSTEAQAKLDKAAATKRATDQFKLALFLEFPPDGDSPGGKVSFADRCLQYESAIRAYAEKHRDQILLDKLKSRKLNYGELGWKEAPDSIGTYAGVPKEGNAAVLEELSSHLRKSLASYEGLPPALLDCLSIDVAWSRDAIAAALKLEKVTRDDLRSIGFKLEKGEDEFFARPAKTSGASLETVADE